MLSDFKHSRYFRRRTHPARGGAWLVLPTIEGWNSLEKTQVSIT
jgi:hypothetical protein